MTDAEMIAGLRKFAHDLEEDRRGGYVLRGGYALLREAAGRLQTLTKPPPLTAPVAPGRWEEIRARAAVEGPSTFTEAVEMADWQAERADLAEAALWDALQEDGRFEAGVRSGAARALEAVQRAVEEEDRLLAASPGRPRHYVQALVSVRLTVRERCGAPADLTPHERLRARVALLEAALREILPLTGRGDGGVPRAVEIARHALTQEGP